MIPRSLFSLLLCLLLTTCAAQPQTKSPAGESLIRPVPPSRLNFEKEGFGGVKAYKGKGGVTVMRLTTVTRPKNIHNLSRSVPLKKAGLQKGRVVLLSFEAKTEVASLETGEGKLLCLLKQSDSFKDNLDHTVSIGSGWRKYYFPYTLTKNVAAGELSAVFQFGYPEQEILVRGVDLAVYPAGTNADDLPRTRITYAGRDTDADWRTAAAARIERNRKGSFSLRVVDEKGEPRPGVSINVKLRRHDFGWGAAVNSRLLASDPERLDRIAETFNIVVFENDLKIKRWAQEDDNEQTLEVMDRLMARNVAVKGHVLIWPGERYLTPEIRAAKNNPALVQRLVEDHVDDILKRTAGKVSHWDVVNETYSNRYLQEITGSEEILYNGFRTVARDYPEVGRFTNEFGIISRGGHDATKQEWYYDYIRRVDKATGGLVQGIGLQCHMGSDLTPPEKVWELLDYYAELGKKISVSEFTLDLDDPELRFDYTRDFITLAFSHPAVSEFLFWGHDERTHPKAAIFNAAGEPADMGAAFFGLVHGLWKTELAATTDQGGRIQGRGFYGVYEYEYTVDGKAKRGEFELLPGAPVMLDLR